MNAKYLLFSGLTVLIGGATGHALSFFPVPLPYLLGALLANAVIVLTVPQSLIGGFRIPEILRQPFIAIIGLFIGAQVHLETIAHWGAVGALLAALTLFTPLAFAANYWLFRNLAKYDAATAFFAGSPGGLIEAIEFGTEAGADTATLVMQQFLRIVLVVTLVPLAMSLWVGHPVGSAAGLSADASATTTPIWILCILAGVGFVTGKALRLPAGQLTGPLIVAAFWGTSGLLPLTLPTSLIIAAQIVIGTALGLRFNGISGALLRRGALMGLSSVCLMLVIGAAMTGVVISLAPLRGDVALLSFAPGGVTEMALVALSLAADPAIVTLSHVYRIVLTVVILTVMHHRFKAPTSPPT